MPKVVINNLNRKEFDFEFSEKTLLAHFQQANQDVMFACGGKGRCTTCKMRVLSGAALLSGDSAAEIKYREQGRLLTNERLTCQCKLILSETEQTLELFVPKPSKLPHLVYSE
jgi:2Fe-2S ferredoxin